MHGPPASRHPRWPRIALALVLGLYLVLFIRHAAFGQIVKAQAQPDDPQQALVVLREILNRPEFQWQEQQPSLLERLWQQILPRLLNLLPDSVAGQRILIPILAALGLLATVAAFAYATRRLRQDLAPDIAGQDGLPSDTTRDSEHAMRRAQSLSRQGDYRMALRYLYLSTLLLLNDRGLIQYDRTRTNREYLQNVAHHPQLKATLQEIVEIFDRTWYGLSAPDAKTYDRFEALVHRLRTL